MKSLTNQIVEFLCDEQGTESLEWAMLCGVIVLAGAAVYGTIRNNLATLWTTTNTQIGIAAGNAP